MTKLEKFVFRQLYEIIAEAYSILDAEYQADTRVQKVAEIIFKAKEICGILDEGK